MKLTDVTRSWVDQAPPPPPPTVPEDDFGQFDDAPASTPTGAVDPAVAKGYDEVMTELRGRFSDRAKCSLDDLEEMVKATIAALPVVDAEAVRDELGRMNVPVYDDPTPTQLAAGMADVQTFKDRAGALANQVERVFMVRKRTLDMLFDANQAVSSASSVDKRRGEAQLRWPMLQLDLVNIEALRLEIGTVMQNLRAKGDVFSRQASIIQMQIQLGEYTKRVPRGYGETRPEDDPREGAGEVDWDSV